MSVRYEDLRAEVLGQGDGHRAVGLVVLLRQGVAAWVDTCAERQPPHAPAEDTQGAPGIEGATPVEDAAHAELVRVVANMVLHHYQEEYT